MIGPCFISLKSLTAGAILVAAEVVLKALRHVWISLEPLHAPMAVMGGLALAAWRHVRATRDVDLLVGVSEEDLEPLLSTLTSAGLRPKRQPAVTSLGSLQILQLLYEPPGAYLDLQVDLLLAQSEYHRQALARRIPTRLAALDLDLYVLACEDMIVHKLLAGRLLDRADAAMLLRANRADLNLEYLLGWTRTLSLGAELAQVWEEAFPGEAMPETGGSR
jgi:hypothetical protein